MIIVLGAPRTGTTSCARALEQLKLTVLQYCPITKTDTNLSVQSALDSGYSDYDAIVSSHYNETLVIQWISSFPDATFIHCTRKETDRIKSLNSLDHDADISINEIRRITATLESTTRYFNLDCNWASRLKWETILNATLMENDQLPVSDYPHSNSSVIPIAYQEDPSHH